jgi:hypothetical protein
MLHDGNQHRIGPLVDTVSGHDIYLVVDTDAARLDGPSALSSTKSQTCAVKVYRASSSASASCRATNSALSCPTALSR